MKLGLQESLSTPLREAGEAVPFSKRLRAPMPRNQLPCSAGFSVAPALCPASWRLAGCCRKESMPGGCGTGTDLSGEGGTARLGVEGWGRREGKSPALAGTFT